MSILAVPVTATSQFEWNRRIAAAVNQLIGKKLELKAVTSAYTVEDGYDLFTADSTGAAFTITLPPAPKHKGRAVYVKRLNAGANNVTIDGSGSETIDGAANTVLTTQWESRTLFSDGSNWLIL